MRKVWTDERMDDLSKRVDQRFDEVDRRFGEVDRRFDEVNQRFNRVETELRTLRVEMGAEFTALRGEMKAGFDKMHRTMLQFAGVLIVALVGMLATLAVR